MTKLELTRREGEEQEKPTPSVFENLKNQTKEFALKKLGELKGRAETFAKENWAKISGKTTEWISDITDSLKLRTVDKWQLAKEGRITNKLIQHKEKDIDREAKKVDKLSLKIEKEKASRQKSDEGFVKLLGGIGERATLVGLVNKIQTKQASKSANRLDTLTTERDARIRKQEGQKIIISNYENRLEGLENAFVGKIDERIEKIKSRDNYEQNIELARMAEENISALVEQISLAEKELLQYRKVWEQRKLMEKEDKKELKGKIVELEQILKKCDKALGTATKLKSRCSASIEKTERRVGSLEEFKSKYVEAKNTLPEIDAGTTAEQVDNMEEQYTFRKAGQI